MRLMANIRKHPKTGIYWYRKVVPVKLRSIIGKTEIVKSLETRSKETANRKAAPLEAEAQAMFARP